MRRRDFIRIVSSATVYPFAAYAQQTGLPVIGFLNSASSSGYEERVAAFKKGLQESSYIADQNVAIEYRWADSQFDRLPALAADLVQRRVAVIAASGSPNPAQAAKAATQTIPIVFAYGGDPITNGVVTNLARPGANISGVTFYSNVVMAKLKGELAKAKT